MTREMLRRLARGTLMGALATAVMIAAELPGGPFPAFGSGGETAGWPNAETPALDPVSVSAAADRSDVTAGESLALTWLGSVAPENEQTFLPELPGCTRLQ